MHGEKKMDIVMTKIRLQTRKPRNLIAKDLFTSKYHMRVVQSEKKYNRKKLKQQLKKDIAYG
jgi:hypothetical protein